MATPAFCPSPAELALDRLVVSSEGITVVATARRLTVPWPMCGKVARRVHSHYTRTVADLPCMECTSASLPTCAASCVITCDRRGCRRRGFTKRLPDSAASYARRTGRAALALEAIGFAVGGRPGAR